jgi:cyclophilin family peptidyl-prolyl cis-trans isomerase
MKNLTLFILLLFSFNVTADEKVAFNLVLKTNKGPIVIDMNDYGAPIHFDAITKMVDMGLYNGTAFSYAEKGFFIQLGDEYYRDLNFFEEQAKVIQNLPYEKTKFQHHRGTVTMPNPTDTQSNFVFTVMLDRSEELDNKQTIIGFVTYGLDLLDETANGETKEESILVKPLRIESAAFMTKDKATIYVKEYESHKFKSELFDFTKYSFLLIIIIQLILFHGKEKLDAQVVSSIQISVLLIATFSLMAQFYPMVQDSILASMVMVAGLVYCFKIMASLEKGRTLSLKSE